MYIDPGAGSIMLQIAGAAIIGIAAAFSRVRTFIGTLFGRRRRK